MNRATGQRLQFTPLHPISHPAPCCSYREALGIFERRLGPDHPAAVAASAALTAARRAALGAAPGSTASEGGLDSSDSGASSGKASPRGSAF